MKRFTLTKKLVAQVRFYEQLYMISDTQGVRVYTGTDAAKAKEILAALNAYYVKRKPAKKGKRKPAKKGKRTR